MPPVDKPSPPTDKRGEDTSVGSPPNRPATPEAMSAAPTPLHASDADPGGLPPPRWGLGDAALGFLVALVSAAIGLELILAATGHTDAEDVPIGVIALLQATLWVGLLGAPIVAGRYRGNGVVRDFGLRGRPIDLPVGLGLGLVCQFLLVPLVSYPWVRLLGRDLDDVSTAARDLIDKATDPLGVALLVVIVVIGAPIIEELFFRGLVQRAVARRFGAGWAIAASSLLFGLAHFQTLQAPALVALGVVLGLLAHRNGRLGPGIATHMTFNAVTVVALLLA